jgi:hypothetical protein
MPGTGFNIEQQSVQSLGQFVALAFKATGEVSIDQR